MVRALASVVSQQVHLVKVPQVALVGDALPDGLLFGGVLLVHTVDAEEHIETIDNVLHECDTQFVFL